MKQLIENYFEQIPTEFKHHIKKDQEVLEVLALIPQIIEPLNLNTTANDIPPTWGELYDNLLYIKHAVKTTAAYFNPKLNIHIGANCRLEPNITIGKNVFVGADCELRNGAYLREHSLVGANCVIGHCTEIKHSILMNNVEAGHFNYIGNSLVGNYVNLGAGVKIANLEFRSLKEKKLHRFSIIKLNSVENSYELTKLGGILGDGVELGCNAVVSPGTFLGKECSVLPNLCVLKGVYPAKQRIKH